MSKDVIQDKAAMHRLIGNSIRRVLGEAPIAPPAPAPPPPTAAPAAPAATQPPPGDGVNQVSVSRAAGAGDNQDLTKGQITIEMIVEKLNSIRSGRSFKDENILSQMSQYFNDLNDNEKLALYAFLKGISQIVTGDIPAQQAANQQSVAQEMNTHGNDGTTASGMKDIRHIKPNIIKKFTPQAAPQPKEDTSPPSPIVPKQR